MLKMFINPKLPIKQKIIDFWVIFASDCQSTYLRGGCHEPTINSWSMGNLLEGMQDFEKIPSFSGKYFSVTPNLQNDD